MICHFHWYWPIALCTAFFTAYVVIRTVPQSINGQTRGKKKNGTAKICKSVSITLEGEYDQYMKDTFLPIAGYGDGHIVTVLIAVLLATLTGRSDLQRCLVQAKRALLLSC